MHGKERQPEVAAPKKTIDDLEIPDQKSTYGLVVMLSWGARPRGRCRERCFEEVLEQQCNYFFMIISRVYRLLTMMLSLSQQQK